MDHDTLRVALAQLHLPVGDLDGNAERLTEAMDWAETIDADVLVCPELAITGYPPEDLVLKPTFVARCQELVAELAGRTGAAPLVVGFVEQLRGSGEETWRPIASTSAAYPPLANSAAVLRNQQVEAVYRKHRLPNYGVFDEARYFRAGTRPCLVDVAGTRVGVTICEDLWGEGGPVHDAAAAGAG